MFKFINLYGLRYSSTYAHICLKYPAAFIIEVDVFHLHHRTLADGDGYIRMVRRKLVPANGGLKD